MKTNRQCEIIKNNNIHDFAKVLMRLFNSLFIIYIYFFISIKYIILSNIKNWWYTWFPILIKNSFLKQTLKIDFIQIKRIVNKN